ncbi:MAG: hypothetical protein ACXV3A_02890 [Kineosporiaceae bacterium]
MTDPGLEEFVAACAPRLRRLCLVLTGEPDRAEHLLVAALAHVAASWSRTREQPEAHARAFLARAVAGRRGDPDALLRAYDELSGEGLPHLVDADPPAGGATRVTPAHLDDVRRLLREHADRLRGHEPARPPRAELLRRELARVRLRRGGVVAALAAALLVLVAAIPALGRGLAEVNDRLADEGPLPSTLFGRERLGLADLDLARPQGTATVRVVPASLDLAVAVACVGSRDIVDVRVAVNSGPPDHQVCTGDGVDQRSAGGSTFEGYWASSGVTAGRPMTVTAQAVEDPRSDAPLRLPLPGVHLVLAVYGTPPPATRLPAVLPDRPVGVPADARLVAGIELGPERRTWTTDGVPVTDGPFLLAVACGGPSDAFGFRADVGGAHRTRMTGACSAGQRVAEIGVTELRGAGVVPGRPLVLTAMMTTTPERPEILTGPLHAGAAVRVWLFEER